jgi:hypothetical protein
MTVRFTWSHLWAFYHDIESDEIKASIEEEVIGRDWLYRQPAKEQFDVLADAPQHFIKRVVAGLRPDVQMRLGYDPYLLKSTQNGL